MNNIDTFQIVDGIKITTTSNLIIPHAKLRFFLDETGVFVDFISSNSPYICTIDGLDDFYDTICFAEDNSLASIRSIAPDRIKKVKIPGTINYGFLSMCGKINCFPRVKFRYLNKQKRYLICFNETRGLSNANIVLFTKDFGFIIKNKKYIGWYIQNPLNYLCNETIDVPNYLESINNDDYELLDAFLNINSDNRYFKLNGDDKKLAIELWDAISNLTCKVKNEHIKEIFIVAAKNYYEWRIGHFPN
ncbi:hypothetical protein [Bartonella sp. HY406]|uniref:hypothetical protein n=1 Tax=Bartonella sp. HY406 TaxID=2979331 RepID=UPI0021C9C06A|nr:hypothetical protein [Bartonella sp. HY406]UXN04334.1 hypothetical protein N6B01_04730 [Bartonella sp. HY406]